MITGALILIMMIYFVYSRVAAQAYAISKFKYSRKKNLEFYNALMEYVKANDIAHITAFEDSDISYGEIIEVLEEKFTIEFSEIQLSKLINSRFSDAEINDFIDRMQQHEEIMVALKHNFKHKDINYCDSMIA